MKVTTTTSQKTLNRKVKKLIEAKRKQSALDNIRNVQQLVHTLQVYQVELEHQNQELRITEEELEASRNRYFNLFDLSPIPYFVLDPDGIIKEVNLRAAQMIGIGRNKLIGRNLSAYVPFDEKKRFNTFLRSILKSSTKQSCNVKVINREKRVSDVLLEGVKLADTPDADQRCQIALIDLTEYKKLESSLKVLSEQIEQRNGGKAKFIG